MSNLTQHALVEFRAAGWTDENGNFNDDMQKSICQDVILLLEVFGSQGHSGASAPYALDLFTKLSMFEPISPLTGEDWEWAEVSQEADSVMFQNIRCSHVFKDSSRFDGQPYDIDGIVFWEWAKLPNGEIFKSYFTSGESAVPITFPYIPNQQYVFKPTEEFPYEHVD